MPKRTAADMEVHDHLEDSRIEAEKLLGIRESDDEQSLVTEDEALEVTEESEEEPVEETEETTEDEDFIPRADLESLLDGVDDDDTRERIITAYKSFQRSATKRNQESAALLRQFENVDPSAAREAYDFLESLKTDREFATLVHSQLAEALELEGATPAQAKRQATEMVREASAEGTDEFSEWGLDKDNPLVKEIEESRQFRKQAEQFFANEAEERRRQILYAQAAEQDAAIRAANPKYDDRNMEVIYRLATSFGGSLEEAAEYYEAMRAEERTEYVASKKAKPGAGPLPGGSAHGEEPIEINSVADAHEVALRMLKEGNIPD